LYLLERGRREEGRGEKERERIHQQNYFFYAYKVVSEGNDNILFSQFKAFIS